MKRGVKLIMKEKEGFAETLSLSAQSSALVKGSARAQGQALLNAQAVSCTAQTLYRHYIFNIPL